MFVAPLAGVAAGGALFGQVGAAVGWLVGSWLFSENQQRGNEIFDPGAEEMPRFNTALRGATMPVLFGTNRVSSQIVWQHDFTTIRKESSASGASGGKFGGSGMKGASAPSNTSVSYQYKWDLIYHLGMIPQQYSLYGGWLGPDRLSADTIISITNNSAGSYNVFFGFNNEATIAQKASLVFEEGFFYQGLGPGNDQGASIPGWDEIQSDEGQIIRWPHTAWIGFKQIDLGGSPHIPQLAFEIGPGSPNLDFDTAYIGSALPLVNTQSFSNGSPIRGDDGNLYIVGGEFGSFAGSLHKYDPVNNTYSLHATFSGGDVDSDATSVGLDPGGNYSFTSLNWAAAVPGTNYFIMTGFDIGFATRSNRCVVLYKIDENGQRVALGGYQARAFSTTNNFFAPKSIGLAGEGTENDPIITYGSDGNITPKIMLIPPPALMNGAALIRDDGLGTWDENVINISSLIGGSRAPGSHNSYRSYISFGWFLPEVSVGLAGAAWKTRLYFYISKSDAQWAIDNPGSAIGSDYVESVSATYPNGAIEYISIGEIFFDVTERRFTLIPVPTGPINDNTNFVGLYDNNVRVPFDDAGANRDGTEDDNDDYMPDPEAKKLTRGQAQGAYLVLFSKVFTGVEDLSPTGDFVKVRGFIYNPLAGTHSEFGTAEGSPWDTVSDIGAQEADRYSANVEVRKAIWDEESSELYIFDSKTLISSSLDQTHFGQLGSFDVNGGSDVLVPYIIYEILTNPWFGLGKPESDIDQDSYVQALLYCDANDFRVSVQYRREENALDVIESLLSIYGGFLIISNGKIKFKQLEFLDGSASTVRTIDNHHLLSDLGEVPVQITKGAKQDTFNKVRVNFIDRSLDYQQNQVEEADEVDQDLFGIRMREFPSKYVMSEKTARTMAWRSLWGNLYSRDTYQFNLGWKDADLEPGDVITLVDSHDTRLSSGVTARIVHWKEERRGKFAVTAKQEYDYILSSSASALNISSASQLDLVSKVPEPAYFRMYELPAEFQVNDNGEIYVGWVPNEFASGAFLWISPDGETFAEAAQIEPYALGGKILSSLPILPAGAVQENIEVVLFPKSDYHTTNCLFFNATLNEAGPAVRALGGALIWVGSEMIGYENVTLVSQNRYTLGKVYRGWGGTPIGSHSSGDFWWKHGGGVFKQAINEDRVGNLIQYKVQPHNLGGVRIDIDSIDAQTYTIVGAHYLPQVAKTPQFSFDGVDYRGKTTVFVNSTIDISIKWSDSARKSGFGAGGFGIGEYGRFTVDPQSHSWRVEIIGSGDTVVRSTVVSTPEFTYTSSQNFSDNGAWRGNVAFQVTPFSAIGDAPRTEVVSLELWQ